MQSDVYDRRIPAQKKLAAQEFSIGKRDRDETLLHSNRRTKSAFIDWTRGMLVVVPFQSPTGESSFWFAKIVNVSNVEAQLIELQRVEGNVYKANLSSSWAEPLSVLFAADADYDDHSNTYTLRTPESEILALIE